MNAVTIYETAVTSKAANDLVLFADSTKELIELKDDIFSSAKDCGDRIGDHNWFKPLLNKARAGYCNKNGGASSEHIINMNDDDKLEFCAVYAYRFYVFVTSK